MLKTKSAGGIILNSKGEIAVVNHDGVFWGFPKGHVEEGEEMLTAAKREIAEEVGITDVDMKKVLEPYTREKMAFGNETEVEVKTIYMYVFETSQTDFVLTDPRHGEARWVKPEEVEALLTHPKDKAFFASIKDVVK